jgi:branched-subunit amino acid aminotransferase/4-amino-4-deoxychorismate lyase
MGRMRFTRSEGIPIPAKIQRLRGRPIGSHKQDGVFTTIRVSDNLKEILDWERKPGERYSDTVQRMLYERTQKIQALTQENHRLESKEELR